jgi:hypothetical protein
MQCSDQGNQVSGKRLPKRWIGHCDALDTNGVLTVLSKLPNLTRSGRYTV